MNTVCSICLGDSKRDISVVQLVCKPCELGPFCSECFDYHIIKYHPDKHKFSEFDVGIYPVSEWAETHVNELLGIKNK